MRSSHAWVRSTGSCRRAARSSRPLFVEPLESRLLLAVVLRQSFAGLGASDTNCNCAPPDTQLAVGPTSVISAVNTAFAIKDKSGGVVAAAREAATFFSSVHQPGKSFSDPYTLYDDTAGRFYVGIIEFQDDLTGGAFDLAVSKSSNPTSLTSLDWSFYQFSSVNEGNTQFPDFPKMGWNKDAIFVSFNQFSTAGSNPFAHDLILSIDKASVLSGGTATSRTTTIATGSDDRILIPARMHGQATGNLEYFVQTDSAASDTVNVLRMTNYLTAAPTLTTTTFAVNAYSDSPGVSGLTSQIDDRMLSADWVGDRLVAAQDVGVGGLNLARWYQFHAPLIGAPTLSQQGEINVGAGVHTAYPSVAINPAGDVALSFIQSSAAQPYSMYVVGRAASDPAGVMRSPVLVAAGSGPAVGTLGRGGDYSATEYDPADPTVFWSGNEYKVGSSTNTFSWGTRIAAYSIDPAPSVVAATPRGGQASPVSAATLTFDIPMNKSSFDAAADVLSFTGPTGDLKPLISGATWNAAGTVLTINFPTQTAAGDYSLVIGPQITSATDGLALDNNGDGISGDDPGDNLTLAFRVLSVSCESFDTVAAPALPAGWTNDGGASGPAWATTTTNSFSGANSVMIADVNRVSDTRLVSPTFSYTVDNNQVQFESSFDLETGYDGGVLEISVNGGAYQDILAAGGSFISGGYTRSLSTNFSNPLGGRQAWTGNSGGYVLTSVSLPNSAAGQPVQLRWRLGTDSSVSRPGWQIDDLCLPRNASTLSIAATNSDRPEGNSGSTPFTFTVTRTGDSSAAATVKYAVVGSGASPASAADFTGGVLPSGTLSFAAEQTAAVITINVVGDGVAEPDEGFSVTLSNPTGGAAIGAASATGTIRNDDTTAATTLSIAATSANKVEGNTGSSAWTFTVTRSGAITGSTTVLYAVMGVGASPANAADFLGNVLPSGSVTFTAYQTSKVVSISVLGDVALEPDETFQVVLSNASAGTAITTAVASGTIRNDDLAPTRLAIAATSADKAEGHAGTTPFTFTVTRSGDLTGVTTVQYSVAGTGANAANDADFVGAAWPSGVVSFAANQTSIVVTVPVAGDSVLESPETFQVTLSNPSAGVSITTAAANGTIRNDDATLAIATYLSDKAEGNFGSTQFWFTVTRGGDTTSPASVSYSVAGTSANAADAADFGGVLPSGTLSFGAYETVKYLILNVSSDAVVEPDEFFLVTLANASAGAAITAGAATGAIRNDDASLAIAAVSADKTEGNSGVVPFTFSVARSGLLTGVAVVSYTVAGAGVSPANAADFANGILPSGSVIFSAGESVKTITVNVRGDTTVEPDETFGVTLSGASGASVTTASATGAILTDDFSASASKLSADVLHVGQNSVTISGATPGRTVTVVSGSQLGTSAVAQYGVRLGVRNPVVVGQGIVGPDGNATVIVSLPASINGRSLALQAYERATRGRVSNLVVQPVQAGVAGPAYDLEGAEPVGLATERLTAAAASPIVKEAVELWQATGIAPAQLQLLRQVVVQVADLPDDTVARTTGTTITVDANAADHGWFVDPTPDQTEEFVEEREGGGEAGDLHAHEGRAAADRVDLLTVVLHEMGLLLGHDHETLPIPLMEESLEVGSRRLPAAPDNSMAAEGELALPDNELARSSPTTAYPAVSDAPRPDVRGKAILELLAMWGVGSEE